MPLPGKGITSVFGWRIHPIFHRRIFHDGVDFAAEAGEKVHCVLDGLVRSAGPCPGYGNTVMVYHPLTRTTSMYAHLSRVLVKPGQNVHEGAIVGMAGSTGFSTGVHLHFGVQSSAGKWIDPLAFLHRLSMSNSLAFHQHLDATKSGAAATKAQS